MSRAKEAVAGRLIFKHELNTYMVLDRRGTGSCKIQMIDYHIEIMMRVVRLPWEAQLKEVARRKI